MPGVLADPRQNFFNPMLRKLQHVAYVLFILSMSVLLCLLTCIVWKICWTTILTPP